MKRCLFSVSAMRLNMYLLAPFYFDIRILYLIIQQLSLLVYKLKNFASVRPVSLHLCMSVYMQAGCPG